MKKKNIATNSEGGTIVRYSNEEARALPGSIDWDIVNATTEEDIQRQKIEDGDTDLRHYGEPMYPNGGEVVAKLRARLGLSQEQFSKTYGISIRTLQQWEQKRRAPDGPAMLLIKLISLEPEFIAATLQRSREENRKRFGYKP
jgi:putative transcriptional regulator